ncbi:CpsB/CapC family capsule biosynthesis tyrosine phosphatase [Negativibacillus massiliensis]|uniref:tyrosine-protein phosphatase n=1 Tax=Negativibacillus massiliensis TaxID=1871035 RepID=UPI002A833018|nr:CpsB/CapC family capsule biosynthesis tyrosine phosphatase [Negativibacillus massiliensis]MDY4047460.1 CpsB/CapC family capsule biosynthesis tyrosine phosphatase [Negativibacillus massiliensis]
MIDFHTHILPGIDDGAKSLEESLSLLKMEQEQGVDTIVLTPHYFHERQSLDEFLQQRNTAYEQLRHAAEREKISINFHLGAEVRFSPWLESKEARQLCFSRDGLILVELPFQICPPNVERYPYLRQNPELLYRWISKGAFAQANADSLLAEREGALFILAGIRHGLIHLLGSDTHSVDKRPPRLREAMELLQKSKKLPSREELEQLAEDILQGEILEPAPCTPMKKFLGFR